MSRKPWVGGNWKCNGTKASVDALIKTLNESDVPDKTKCDVIVAPSHIFLTHVLSTINPRFVVSAQDCNQFGNGAYTGSHSPQMLKDCGITTVIIGHSERRDVFRETDEEIGQKIALALKEGFDVVPCIGEHLAERQAGKTNDVLFPQMKAIAANVKPEEWSRVVIAYEPVWAIGTGVVATPQQAQDTQKDLREWIAKNVSEEVAKSVRIVYGGSVNGANSSELSSQPDVDGFLVGGASLKPEFATIVKNIAIAKSQ
ncbi:Triosephosphate isomerase [Blattamonas nauphoetae]|uniref:Triosephosphate isomerase n=1 Tax=Blattamonas nauphoetae TaxID=2049346 RepID=A0ABQ9XT71_9EUKA|nr:Triosephosphate isomerase [Blattamonas nauphoetae]